MPPASPPPYLTPRRRYESVVDPASLGKNASGSALLPEGAGEEDRGYYGLREAVKTREGLSVWLCRLHNIVNRDIGATLAPFDPCNAAL